MVTFFSKARHNRSRQQIFTDRSLLLTLWRIHRRAVRLLRKETWRRGRSVVPYRFAADEKTLSRSPLRPHPRHTDRQRRDDCKKRGPWREMKKSVRTYSLILWTNKIIFNTKTRPFRPQPRPSSPAGKNQLHPGSIRGSNREMSR